MWGETIRYSASDHADVQNEFLVQWMTMNTSYLTGVANDSVCQTPEIARITRASTRKFRPLAKSPGGRCYLARRIIALAPNNISTYVEPFVGGGSVFLNLDPASYERAIINDMDYPTFAMWAAGRDQFDSFYQAIRSIPYTEESFVYHRDRKPQGLVDIAVRNYCIRRMSRGGMCKAFAWSDRLRGGQAGEVNAWLTGLDEVPRIHDRITGVEIHNSDPLSLIGQYGADSRAWLYAAPPFVSNTRTAKKVHAREWTYSMHEDFLAAVRNSKARITISAYACSVYTEALQGWRQLKIDMPNHSGQGGSKQRRVEVLWMNY